MPASARAKKRSKAKNHVKAPRKVPAKGQRGTQPRALLSAAAPLEQLLPAEQCVKEQSGSEVAVTALVPKRAIIVAPAPYVSRERWFPAKTALTVVTFLVLVVVPQWVPSLKDYISVDSAKIAAVFDFPLHKPPVNEPIPVNEPNEVSDSRPARPPASASSPAPMGSTRTWATDKSGKLVDPTHELDRFYNSLEHGGVTHIVHYGDSPTTADLITADARTMFQRRFGDAGIGFVLVAKPWNWYNRRGVEMTSSGWRNEIAGLGSGKDGFYGLGAVSFRGESGAEAKWKLKDTTHTQVEIAYLSEPGGGEFSLSVDGTEIGATSTVVEEGGTAHPSFAPFSIPAGGKEIKLTVTSGSVRLYGADFRKNHLGVVYSSLGVNGANVTLLSHAMNGEHLTVQLTHYQPALVIVNYGTNESGFANFVDTTWGGELRRVVRRLRAALPTASILLMSPMDRGTKNSEGEIATIPTLPHLVEIEQKIALEERVAFFNTFAAMGGEGTMARWYASEPRLVGADYIHPMPAGARIVGELLFSALDKDMERRNAATAPRKVALSPSRQKTEQRLP